jgi:heme A synthase
MFFHRWFAWTGLLAVPAVRWAAKKRGFPAEITSGLSWLTLFVVLQIALGVWTVVSQVNMLIALMHQANAILLFALGIYFITG